MMTMPEIGWIVLVFASAFGTAALTLVGAALLASRRGRSTDAALLLGEVDSRVAFLFDDQQLLDATPAARSLLATSKVQGSDWVRLAGLLRLRFPGLDAAMAHLADAGQIDLRAAHGDDRLFAEWRAGLARIVLPDGDAGGGDHALADRHSLAAMEVELQTLRTITRWSPVVVWKQAKDGSIVWANDSYFGLVEEALGLDECQSWPPPAVFQTLSGVAPETGDVPSRVAVKSKDSNSTRWFECTSHAEADGILCFATPAESLVRAEEALREFVQTLSKTFADLPIGLAIFDRARRLALFNPALTDLTALEVEFLASRPTLFSFLDHLRDRRRIPEPRDYRSWRQRMTELEAAAAEGFVQEDWSLPTGQTFRVTGRPHPDGAVAFLFEDISAEVSLTRRFRSELELGQTVIDSLDEAIAVFSPAGVINFSNAAYAALWGIDPSVTLTEVGILDAVQQWQARSKPSPIWGDARDFLAAHEDRAEWSGTVDLTDGRHLHCRFQPLSGGATLVGFAEIGQEFASTDRSREVATV